jgi:phosphomannomutase/phosphoglucomutase
MMMNPEIFRQYDIRGIVDKDLTEKDVVELGQGIGTFLISQGHRSITVGRDCRTSSDSYSQCLIEGLIATGCNVVDIGVCSTPVSYFSIRHLEKEGGVMVTASHNPPEYNGFKISSGSSSVFGEQIQQIRRLIENQAFAVGQGRVERVEIVPAYIKYIVRNIKLSHSLSIGVDAGNGTAGVVAVPILSKLGCKVEPLYCEMDGTFPNHEADPTVAENMADLIKLVRNHKLDVGFGFDGDGDRIGVVDNQGNMIFGDQLMIIFAREILSRKPGAVFISEVKCSKTMYDDIEAHGGQAIMWKTGHSMIKQKMKEVQAELAGEMSGHIFFSDRYLGYDDAVYAACRLLEILANTGKTISELLADVPKTFTTPEIRVDCPDEIKFSVVRRITDYFRRRYDVIDIDGARILFADGWGLVRASNTQPALVLRFEALSKKRLVEIRKEVEGVLGDIKKS